MVQSRKHKTKAKLLASHERSWIWGRHLVLEILQSGRWPIIELYADDALTPAAKSNLSDLAQQRDIDVRWEPAERLYELCHVRDHQGYLARMGEFPYAALSEILARKGAWALPNEAEGSQHRAASFIAILDRVQDPFNLGAIARSAEALGVTALVIGEKEQTGVTSMVARSSAGAISRIPLARVGDLTEAVREIAQAGYQVLAASEKSEAEIFACDFSKPAAVIFGNEGQGISPELRAICSADFRIPQAGTIGSLNVAAAAVVVFYEVLRQNLGK